MFCLLWNRFILFVCLLLPPLLIRQSTQNWGTLVVRNPPNLRDVVAARLLAHVGPENKKSFHFPLEVKRWRTKRRNKQTPVLISRKMKRLRPWTSLCDAHGHLGPDVRRIYQGPDRQTEILGRKREHSLKVYHRGHSTLVMKEMECLKSKFIDSFFGSKTVPLSVWKTEIVLFRKCLPC